MIKNILFFFSFSIILCIALGLTIDNSALIQIIEKFKKFSTAYPQEKIHIQTDKPYYIAGEEIWLKAYIVTAQENVPSELSKILHVELINQDNEVSKKITLAIDSGKAWGQITLPDSITTGNYRLRAFTNYMRNFDHDFFFEKFITIKNIAEIDKAKIEANVNKELNAQFFPEGGDLIYGLRSKVGIKVVDKNGIGVNCSGYILDGNQQKVALFTAEHAGLGSFALQPLKGQTYKAIIEKSDGSLLPFSLPKIEDSGYSLSINTVGNPNDITVKIATTQNLINSNELSLIAQCNGKIYFTSTAKMDNAVLTATIPKTRFPNGIIQFTLFAEQTPLAERIVFINHNNQIKINIKPENIAAAESKTKLNFSITDENDNPLDGNFSVSVVDAEKVVFREDDETSILSNLLLTSDLRGYIEQPNYYFNNINPDKERQLDNLLLTQGWRRFVWKDLLADIKIPINFKAEKSLTISGTITNLNNKPEANAKVSLLSVTNGFDLILDTLTDETGRFYFDRLDIPDTVDFFVQAKTAKGSKDVKISIEKNPKSNPKKYIGIPVNMDVYVNGSKGLINNNSNFKTDGIRLNEVTIAKKKELKPIVNVLNSKSRNGSANYVVSKDRIENETGSAFNIFNNVPGVKMQEGKIMRAMANTTSMAPNFQGKPQPMIVILDGHQVEQDVLLTTPASAVEGIEVLVSNYNTVIYENGYWGVLLVTTKMGGYKENYSNNILNINMQKISGVGLSQVKEFYKPQIHVDSKLPENQLNYSKSTVYWNPNINTNENGKATVVFPNSLGKKYKITAEGMDAYGNYGRKTLIYTLN